MVRPYDPARYLNCVASRQVTSQNRVLSIVRLAQQNIPCLSHGSASFPLSNSVTRTALRLLRIQFRHVILGGNSMLLYGPHCGHLQVLIIHAQWGNPACSHLPGSGSKGPRQGASKPSAKHESWRSSMAADGSSPSPGSSSRTADMICLATADALHLKPVST